jgi:hypothetical protein
LIRRRSLSALLLAGALFAPAAAQASTTQESIVQDDNLLLYSAPATRDATLDEFAALGADTIRALVVWDRVAPSPTSLTKPAGDLDLSDPATYGGNWAPYDGLVSAAKQRGLQVLLTPTGPGPAWASACTGSASARQACRPRPAEFRRFVAALTKHFSGQHRWAIWNEPNVSAWLSPQFSAGKPTSPDLYRSLYRAALGGLRDAGHGSDRVLLGETAPSSLGSASASAPSMATLTFIDRLFCMTSAGRRVTSGTCRGAFTRLTAAGFATHPYVRGGSAGPTAAARPGEVTIGSVGRLESTLDRAARLGRIAARLPVFFTEYGFQTNPPDHLLGVSLNSQAAFINQSDYIAYGLPRVRSVAQYLLDDDAAPSGFQSGLRFVSGRAKPALAAYRLPIWVRARGSSVTVFGQVRPAADSARETVLIQNKPVKGGFRTVRRVTVSNRKGFFTVNLPKRAGLWRLSWTPTTGGSAILSRESGASSK